MNVVELFYFLGFFFAMFAVGWLMGKPFGTTGWVIGGVAGLILWGGLLWGIKLLCEKSVVKRGDRAKEPGNQKHGE